MLSQRAQSLQGTASFSEPHWLDQLLFNPLAEPAIKRGLRVCIALEALTARLQRGVPGWEEPTNFMFNPKAGGLRVAEAAVKAFPHARHAFMYRACHKVVESFGGLIFHAGVPTLLSVAWRLLGTSSLRFVGAGALVNNLPLSELSSAPVAMLTNRWISTIIDWIAICERRSASMGSEDPLASAVVIRMDEFTTKDLKLRASVVRAALEHLGTVEPGDEDAISAALAVFSVHSQAQRRPVPPPTPSPTKPHLTHPHPAPPLRSDISTHSCLCGWYAGRVQDERPKSQNRDRKRCRCHEALRLHCPSHTGGCPGQWSKCHPPQEPRCARVTCHCASLDGPMRRQQWTHDLARTSTTREILRLTELRLVIRIE